MRSNFTDHSLQRGDEVLLTVESLADRGKALARIGTYVVFVRGAAPGDRVKAAILRVKRSYAEAKVLAVLAPGPSRVTPKCRYFGTCGGCTLQHVEYGAQLKAKEDAVKAALRQAADVPDSVVSAPIGSRKTYHYRNKMEFSFSAHRWLTPEEIASGAPMDKSFALGLHPPRNFLKVLDLKECWLQPSVCTEILCGVRDFVRRKGWEPWNIRNRVGFLRHLVVRKAAATDDLMVNLVTRYHDASRMDELSGYLHRSHPAVTTLVNTVNDTPAQTALGTSAHVVFGSGILRERLGPFQFEIAPSTFFQPNTLQAARLCETVQKLGAFQPDDLVLDLYCGTGTFSICVAASVRRVIGIELVPEAVLAARQNAALNGMHNCTFIAGDMLKAITPALLGAVGRPDAVIVDPPRAGMHPRVVRRLARLRPSRIIYVSCSPRSQARDLALLKGAFEVAAVQPLDLFPQTHHVESIVLLRAR